MTVKTSSIPGFRRLPMAERRRVLAEAGEVDAVELAQTLDAGGLGASVADAMVENAIGTLALPLGVALYLRVNDRDYLAPMATEEPSVIAAASHAAKRVRQAGGFRATVDDPRMIAQIAVHDAADPAGAVVRVREAQAELIARANEVLPGLCARGGGAREVSARDLGDGLVVTHVVVDCRDAMGANMLNTVAEALGPRVEALVGGDLGLRILSNYSDQRCTRVVARLPVRDFGCSTTDGATAARGVARASLFAEKDPYRAATHNKGIMNGIDALAIATGNDFRAIEAGAHAYASRSGRYGPLATWRVSDDGDTLEGCLELPLALGIVGGALRAHAGARACLAMTGVTSASELAMVAAALGLASNLAALRALATDGIQRGHMALHRRA
jgi:hydroxymethylglutaryl-CoA reductase